MAAELEVVARYYDLLLWVIPEVGRVPRNFRFTLGEKIEVMLYEGLDSLLEARYSGAAERRPILARLKDWDRVASCKFSERCRAFRRATLGGLVRGCAPKGR